MSIKNISFTILLLLFCCNYTFGQCANYYVDNYAAKQCSGKDSLHYYFYNTHVTKIDSNQIVIHNFAGVPFSVIWTEDTIIGTINCFNDSLSLTTVTYNTGSGQLIYSGTGKVYPDSIRLYLHQVNPNFSQNLCYTYKKGLTVGNSEKKEHNEYSIFPNPTTSKLTLNFKPESLRKVDLLSPDGKLIRSIDVNLNEISLSKIPSGIYILRLLTNENRVITKKIVKQ